MLKTPLFSSIFSFIAAIAWLRTDRPSVRSRVVVVITYRGGAIRLICQDPNNLFYTIYIYIYIHPTFTVAAPTQIQMQSTILGDFLLSIRYKKVTRWRKRRSLPWWAWPLWNSQAQPSELPSLHQCPHTHSMPPQCLQAIQGKTKYFTSYSQHKTRSYQTYQ